VTFDPASLPNEGTVVGRLDSALAAAVVIATYNEAENLPSLLERLDAVAPAVGVVVVDDGSPDGTGKLADERAEANSGRLVVIHRQGKGGYASAVRRGLAYGYANNLPILMTMDADHSHDPAVIPDMLAAIEEADLVIGSRYVPGGAVRNWPWYRILLSKAGGCFARAVTGMPVRDPTGGFRAYRRDFLERIGIWSTRAEGYSFLLEVAFRSWLAGGRIIEIPIIFNDRTRGRSKLSRKIVVEAFVLALALGWTSRWPSARRRFVEEMKGCPPDDVG
jgi:dolichol-phosphate mannosyltransferase